jgi:DNA-binding CsgD family transcriptional regulator
LARTVRSFIPQSNCDLAMMNFQKNDVMSEEALSALINEVYDAALDPSLLQDVLEKSSVFVGGGATAISSKDSVKETADMTHGFEWAQPQGSVDVPTPVLEKSTTSDAVFGLLGHEQDGPSDSLMRHRMKLLAPHVRRAVLISKTIQFYRAETARLADTLDSLAAGLFLTGEKGRLVQANSNGHAIISDGSILRATGGHLVATDPIAGAAMRAAFAGIDIGDAGLGTQAIAVPLAAADGQHYVAHILPLTSGARRKIGTGHSVVAAVFVCGTQLEAPAAPQAIAELYGLTPRELRVLLVLFESDGVSDIAGKLGISEATTKTHLNRLFAKTNTRRQADLVRLVAGFTGPVDTRFSLTGKITL